MSEEQINIAIAEACGWTDCSNIDGTLCGLPIGVTSLKGRYDIIPDYWNELNAMHEAMLTLTDEQGFGFLWNLNDMGYDEAFVGGDWLTLDSQVLAEAFLRTLGKWEGAK